MFQNLIYQGILYVYLYVLKYAWRANFPHFLVLVRLKARCHTCDTPSRSDICPAMKGTFLTTTDQETPYENLEVLHRLYSLSRLEVQIFSKCHSLEILHIFRLNC